MSSPSTFLSLPVEIRLKIYTLLFHCNNALLVEPTSPTHQQSLDDDEDSPSFIPYHLRISPIQSCRPSYLSGPISSCNFGLGLSSQLLLTNKQISSEALPLLYSLNRFNCTLRSAPQIFSQIISTANFAHIRHLLLDWDQLQDFAWSLAKEDQRLATSGLEVLELAHFRTRMLRRPQRIEEARLGISPDPPLPSPSPPVLGLSLWANTRDHERQLHQAALEITQKHVRLRHVVQQMSRQARPRGFQREDVGLLTGGYAASRPIPEVKVSVRVRWRFVTTKGLRDAAEDEAVLDLPAELATLGGPER